MSGEGGADHVAGPGVLSQSSNSEEIKLEAAEAHKYLLAKSYFECREFDRCAAVFLPLSLPRGDLMDWESFKPKKDHEPGKGKGKVREETKMPSAESVDSVEALPKISQKSLFLALYAKYMSGEKRRDEESEMVLGPADGGVTSNQELSGIKFLCRQWLSDPQLEVRGEGWLEYLYGVCLAKSKNFDEAKEWLVRSVHCNSFHWGAWQELGSLIGNSDEVRSLKFAEGERLTLS